MDASKRSGSSPQYKFLILDATHAIDRFVAQYLRDEGGISFDWRSTTTIEELEHALSGAVDLILCNLDAPQTDLADAIGVAQRLRPDAPVIVVAAHPTVQDAVRVMRLGARGLVDASDPQGFLEIVRQELDALAAVAVREAMQADSSRDEETY